MFTLLNWPCQYLTRGAADLTRVNPACPVESENIPLGSNKNIHYQVSITLYLLQITNNLPYEIFTPLNLPFLFNWGTIVRA